MGTISRILALLCLFSVAAWAQNPSIKQFTNTQFQAVAGMPIKVQGFGSTTQGVVNVEAETMAFHGTNEGSIAFMGARQLPGLFSGTNSVNGAVNALSYGAEGNGVTDDTAAIQDALRNRSVYLPPGTYLVGTLYLTNNNEIFGYGARLLRQPETLSGQSIFKVENSTNVTIRNLSLDGNAASQTLDYQNAPFGVIVTGTSTNVTLSSLELYSCKSDGIYIGGLGTVPSGIHVLNCNSHDNGRQGMSITAVDGIEVIGGSFNNSYSTDPGCGIDIEPNATTDVIRNIRLVGVTMKGNQGSGLQIGGATSSGAITQGWIEGAALAIEDNGGTATGYGINVYGVRSTHLQGYIKRSGLSGLGLTKDITDFSWDGLNESNQNHGVELVLSPSTRLGVDNVRIRGTIRNNGQRVAGTYDGIALNATGTWTNGAGTYASMVTNVMVEARIYDDQTIPTQRYGFNNYDGQGFISFKDLNSTGNSSGDFNSGTPALWLKGSFLYLIGGGLSTSASDPGVGNIQATNITVFPGGVLALARTNFISALSGGGVSIANYDIDPQIQLNGRLAGQLNIGIDSSQNNFWKAAIGKSIDLKPDGNSGTGALNLYGIAYYPNASPSTLLRVDGGSHIVGLANSAGLLWNQGTGALGYTTHPEFYHTGTTLALSPDVGNQASLLTFNDHIGGSARASVGFVSNGDTNLTLNVNAGNLDLSPYSAALVRVRGGLTLQNASVLPNTIALFDASTNLISGAAPYTFKVSSTDTTPSYLTNKLVAGSNITLTHNNVGGVETITIASTGGGGAGSGDLTFDSPLTVTVNPGVSTNVSIIANGISDSLIRQSAGVSVVGRSANSAGNVADITASANGQFLARSGNALAFVAPAITNYDVIAGANVTVTPGGSGTNKTFTVAASGTFSLTADLAEFTGDDTNYLLTGGYADVDFANTPPGQQCEITLPSAGTYIITASVGTVVNEQAGSGWNLFVKLVNSTDASDIAGSERRLGNGDAGALATYAINEPPITIKAKVTVGASKVIRLQAFLSSTGGFTTGSVIKDYTTLDYIKL